MTLQHESLVHGEPSADDLLSAFRRGRAGYDFATGNILIGTRHDPGYRKAKAGNQERLLPRPVALTVVKTFTECVEDLLTDKPQRTFEIAERLTESTYRVASTLVWLASEGRAIQTGVPRHYKFSRPGICAARSASAVGLALLLCLLALNLSAGGISPPRRGVVNQSPKASTVQPASRMMRSAIVVTRVRDKLWWKMFDVSGRELPLPMPNDVESEFDVERKATPAAPWVLFARTNRPPVQVLTSGFYRVGRHDK